MPVVWHQTADPQLPLWDTTRETTDHVTLPFQFALSTRKKNIWADLRRQAGGKPQQHNFSVQPYLATSIQLHVSVIQLEVLVKITQDCARSRSLLPWQIASSCTILSCFLWKELQCGIRRFFAPWVESCCSCCAWRSWSCGFSWHCGLSAVSSDVKNWVSVKVESQIYVLKVFAFSIRHSVSKRTKHAVVDISLHFVRLQKRLKSCLNVWHIPRTILLS